MSPLGIRISAASAVHEKTASTNSRQMPPLRASPDVMTIVYHLKSFLGQVISGENGRASKS